MIEIKNLRIEKIGTKYKLLADISSEKNRTDNESTIWISVDEKYKDMLADDVYDMFLFIPVYLSMYYHEDLHICGSVSKELYRNVVDYVLYIMKDFKNDLTIQNIIVDGYKECDSNPSVIGTGISLGVDCLSTIYDRFINETDEDYKLTHVFMLNCGWHGEYGDPKTIELFKARCRYNKQAAEEMGLAFVAVDSNLHAFLYELDDRASFFALYSTIFGLEKKVKKYYISNSYSYDEVSHYGYESRNLDWSEFADPIALPLMRSASLELVCDGCQYTRVHKTKNIADWDIARKYLNVCCRHSNDPGVDESNCSCCTKCNRTLLALDALDKLEDYKDIFDIDIYKRNEAKLKKEVVDKSERVPFLMEIYNLYGEQGKPLPKHSVKKYLRRVKRAGKIILGKQ